MSKYHDKDTSQLIASFVLGGDMETISDAEALAYELAERGVDIALLFDQIGIILENVGVEVDIIREKFKDPDLAWKKTTRLIENIVIQRTERKDDE